MQPSFLITHIARVVMRKKRRGRKEEGGGGRRVGWLMGSLPWTVLAISRAPVLIYPSPDLFLNQIKYLSFICVQKIEKKQKMVFGNFFDSEDTQVKFKLIIHYYMWIAIQILLRWRLRLLLLLWPRHRPWWSKCLTSWPLTREKKLKNNMFSRDFS